MRNPNAFTRCLEANGAIAVSEHGFVSVNDADIMEALYQAIPSAAVKETTYGTKTFRGSITIVVSCDAAPDLLITDEAGDPVLPEKEANT